MGIKSTARQIFKTINSKEKIAVPKVVDSGQLLAGRVAFIAGGSGGIGFAIAKEFLKSGAKVIISGTNKKKLRQKTLELNDTNAQPIILDMNKVQSFDNVLNRALSIFDEHRIDIFVNCAGYNPKKGFFDISEDDYDRTMNINVKGTYFWCQKISKYMISQNVKGHILNLSSSSALRPAWSPYEMSKWTIRGFTKGLADTLISYGIVVNAIAPGPTATPMLGMNEHSDLDLPGNPSKRYAEPVEIANLAVVMVSDLGNLIVGDTVYATGGSGVISLHH